VVAVLTAQWAGLAIGRFLEVVQELEMVEMGGGVDGLLELVVVADAHLERRARATLKVAGWIWAFACSTAFATRRRPVFCPSSVRISLHWRYC
jgi:hypothetical protein